MSVPVVWIRQTVLVVVVVVVVVVLHQPLFPPDEFHPHFLCVLVAP